MAIFQKQKLCIIKQKCQKWPIFVDEIEIDKIRNTAEIFPFVAKSVFSWTLKSFWIYCMEEKT